MDLGYRLLIEGRICVKLPDERVGKDDIGQAGREKSLRKVPT